MKVSWTALLVGAVGAFALASACGSTPRDFGAPLPSGGDGGVASEPSAAGAGATSAGAPPNGGEGGGEGGAAGAPLVRDVVGRVFAGPTPLAGAIVVVNGARTEADAEGRFAFSNVADEYVLLVRPLGEKFVAAYEGVTTRAPVVNVYPSGVQTDHAAAVRGRLVNGWSEPSPENSRKAVAYLGTQPGECEQDEYLPHTEFEVEPRWVGASDDSGELWALQYLADFDRGAYEFSGFGRLAVALTHGQGLGGEGGAAQTDVALADPGEVSRNTLVTAPDDWELQDASLTLGPLRVPVQLALGPGAVTLPELDVPMFVQMSASGDDGSSVVQLEVPAKGDISFEHPAPPKLTSPDADAQVSSDTEFFWEAAPAQTFVTVIFQIGDLTVVQHTVKNSAKLPDLSALRIRVGGPLSGTWSLEASGPATTIEEGMALQHALNAGGSASWFYAWGYERDFVFED